MNGVYLTENTTTTRVETLSRADVVQGTVTTGGFRPPTPYFMSYLHEQRPYGSWKVTRFGRQYEYLGALGDLANLAAWPGRSLPDVPSRIVNDLIIDVLNDLKQQKVNLAVALAEYKSTAALIETNATRIYNGIRYLRKGRWRQAFRSIRHQPRKGWDKELASRVLEFQYGVRPLLQDVYGSLEALAEANHGGAKSYPFEVKKRRVIGQDNELPVVVGDLPGDYLPAQVQTSTHVEVTVALWYSINDSAVKTTSELGLTNPATVLWELVPFSFVVDWFLPIGDYLNALDAHLGLVYRGGRATTWRKVFTSYSGCKSRFNGTSSLSGSYEMRTMNRAVFDNSPIPSPPSLKNPVSMERALNAVSLLTALR